MPDNKRPVIAIHGATAIVSPVPQTDARTDSATDPTIDPIT